MKEKSSPAKVIKIFCSRNCLGLTQFNTEKVSNCEGNSVKCPFFSYRLGKRTNTKTLRAFCLHCMGGNRELVEECPNKLCVVYSYRLGETKTFSEEISKEKSLVIVKKAITKKKRIRAKRKAA